MDYKTLKTNFERELLYQVITRMREKKLSSLRAQKIAQAFLPALKEKTPESFIEHISKKAVGYPEITEAFIAAVRKFELENNNLRLEEIRDQLKGGENNGRK